jgi:hypothetical protein
MPPQFASLIHFPGRVVRQSLPPVAVALGLLSLCNTAFAATRTNSLFVSATVVAGCQVSAASAQPVASAPNGWTAPVSVNCSLPVAYQVQISSSPQVEPGVGVESEPGIEPGIELAGIGPNGPAVAGLPGYMQSRGSLRTPDQPVQATGEPAYSLISLPSGPSTSSNGAEQGANRNQDAHAPGSITVTIVY